MDHTEFCFFKVLMMVTFDVYCWPLITEKVIWKCKCASVAYSSCLMVCHFVYNRISPLYIQSKQRSSASWSHPINFLISPLLAGAETKWSLCNRCWKGFFFPFFSLLKWSRARFVNRMQFSQTTGRCSAGAFNNLHDSKLIVKYNNSPVDTHTSFCSILVTHSRPLQYPCDIILLWNLEFYYVNIFWGFFCFAFWDVDID